MGELRPDTFPVRQIAIVAVAVGLLLAAVSVTGQVFRPPRVNVSQAEYQAALERWQAQRIEEYEITVRTTAYLLGGERTLRVSDGGNTVSVIDPVPVTRLDAETVNYYKADTVEGLFKDVEAFLSGEGRIYSAAFTSSGGFYMSHRVRFHPDMGYPTYIAGRAVTDPGVEVLNADWEKEVVSLKILRRGP